MQRHYLTMCLLETTGWIMAYSWALVALLAASPASAGEDAGGDGTVGYWEMLGEDADEVVGNGRCDTEWTSEDLEGGGERHTCARYDGAGGWEGYPTSFMVSPDGEVVMVLALRPYRNYSAIKRRATSVARHFEDMDACEGIGRTRDHVIENWRCDRNGDGDAHMVELAMTGPDGLELSLSYYLPEGVAETTESAQESKNEGL